MLKMWVDRYTNDTRKNACQGNLYIGNEQDLGVGSSRLFHCHTLERAWEDNRPNVSCIPSGIYIVQPHFSANHGDVLTFIGGTVSPDEFDVEEAHPRRAERWGCHIHSANYPRQLKGCLAPGKDKADDHDGAPAVWNSRETLGKILEIITAPTICYVRWL